MSERVVTIGQSVGAVGDEGVLTVRVGADYLDLSADEYLLWLLSMGAEDRAEMRSIAVDERLDDPDAVIARLVERGLVVVFDDEADLREVFSRYRLIAQGYGLGNTEAEPDVFTVANLDASPRMGMNVLLYSVWGASWHGPLWNACEGVAGEAGVDVEGVARAVARDLSLVVGCRAGIVDLA
jgi:hypothetical protein